MRVPVRWSTVLLASLFAHAVLVPLAGAACDVDRVELQVLGSGGPEFGDRRASSGYLVWVDGRASVLIDMGPGSGLNFERSGAAFEDLDAIAFSHLHVDHSADFPAFIKASYFTSRDRELPVFGPAGNDLMPATGLFVRRLLGPDGAYRYLRDYLDPSAQAAYLIRTTDVPLTPRKISSFDLREGLRITAIPVHHGPVAAVAWRVDAFGCALGFSGDMSHRDDSLESLVVDVDLLVVHNAIPESARGIARALHMPPTEIGRIAHRAAVKRLVLSHRMRRTLGTENETLGYIRAHYDGPVSFADDLSRFDLR